ncbi:hypothetical protein WA158_002373 [Blastocystis sp. Blastoise]
MPADKSKSIKGKKVDFSGWLTKRSVWLKDWRMRYFTLVGDKLYFSKSPQDDPHGCIDLADCLTVKSADEKINKRHCLEVTTSNATYYMFADNESSKDEWIGAIGRTIVRHSKAYDSDE